MRTAEIPESFFRDAREGSERRRESTADKLPARIASKNSAADMSTFHRGTRQFLRNTNQNNRQGFVHQKISTRNRSCMGMRSQRAVATRPPMVRFSRAALMFAGRMASRKTPRQS